MTRQAGRIGELPLRDALISFGALLLVFGAFDDITTDNATTFTVEYAVLVTCAVWFGFLAVKLIRRGHRTFGLLSLAALIGAIWAQRAIVPGITPGLWREYVVMTIAFVWFLALAAGLMVLASRGGAHPTVSHQ